MASIETQQGMMNLLNRMASACSSLLHESIFSVCWPWKENNNHSDIKGKETQKDRHQINEPLHKTSRLRKSLN
jgi:hypothetical protein